MALCRFNGAQNVPFLVVKGALCAREPSRIKASSGRAYSCRSFLVRTLLRFRWMRNFSKASSNAALISLTFPVAPGGLPRAAAEDKKGAPPNAFPRMPRSKNARRRDLLHVPFVHTQADAALGEPVPTADVGRRREHVGTWRAAKAITAPAAMWRLSRQRC